MTWRDIRAVLFDLDGTLIDSAGDLGAAADKLRTDRGLPALGLKRYRSMVGSGARGMVGVALGQQPGDPEYENLRLEFLRNYERGMIAHTRLFDGVERLLRAIEARHCLWGIVTNKAMRFAGPLTAALPPLDQAAVLVGGDSTPHPKPHPQPLLEAARRLSVSPEHCVYVGDDERDVVAGRAAGMRTVVAAYGYLGEGAEHASWNAEAHIAHPLELLDLLQSAAPA